MVCKNRLILLSLSCNCSLDHIQHIVWLDQDMPELTDHTANLFHSKMLETCQALGKTDLYSGLVSLPAHLMAPAKDLSPS
jgi:hypothetical protein